MIPCRICQNKETPVASCLGVCARCIKIRFAAAEPYLRHAHETARLRFDLPPEPPRTKNGRQCGLCSHECSISEGGLGYCGLPAGDRMLARVSWYYDPLPTNCVADFVCPGGTGEGYPRFAYKPGPEAGYNNLAVFYEACSFDCLFCQNWTYRTHTRQHPTCVSERLAAAVKSDTACICFFGGDPTPQLPHSLKAARLARERCRDRILRICWETNGCMVPTLLEEMMALAIESGGCIKFDLKAWDEKLHFALTGVSNRQTLENFRRVASRVSQRPDVPLLVASTLLVPGYVDAEEVGAIAGFIARLDPTIPYSLLAFHPDFMMTDLPRTSAAHANRALRAAQAAGLQKVHLGNRHLLWPGDYMMP